MNAEVFQQTGYYFQQCLMLIVYSYEQIRREKLVTPYSRTSIREEQRNIRKKDTGYTEVEDYLRNNMVDRYLSIKENRIRFNLVSFYIGKGADETESSVTTGRGDIRFHCASATSMDGTAFIFECKRLNKYANSQNAYINDGMMRFVSGQYYAESGMTVAGMIAFVEVDQMKHPNGRLPVKDVANLLLGKIDGNKDALKTTEAFSLYKLTHNEYPEISGFEYSYLSKHTRDKDDREISIHHLLLDYYDILVP